MLPVPAVYKISKLLIAALIVPSIVACGGSGGGGSDDEFNLHTARRGPGELAGAGDYDDGDDANVTAAPDAGAELKEWTGLDAVVCETGSVAMTRDRDCTAVFGPITGVDGIASQVVAGANFSFAIQSGTRHAICWGDHEFGQDKPPASTNGDEGVAVQPSAGSPFGASPTTHAKTSPTAMSVSFAES